MRVRYTKARSFGAVGAQGLITRAFEVGDEVDLPDMHAQVEISLGVAEAISGPTDPVHTPADVFPAPTEGEAEGDSDAETDGEVGTEGDSDAEPEAKPVRRSRTSKV